MDNVAADMTQPHIPAGCGVWFLSLCRKVFTTQVQVAFAVFIKAGDSEPKGGLKVGEAEGEEKSGERAPWRQGQGIV